jgi:hypothetical protein
MLLRVTNKLKKEYREHFQNPALVKGKPKIFCIGRNKTGTTSLKKAFKDLGYIVGNQHTAEKLLPYYKAGNFQPIIKYCLSAQVFQDVPFSYPETFKYLDKAFPGSKFILTVRDSSEEWYQSVTKFQSKLFGKGKLPVKEDLQQAKYVWKGWIWECNRILYSTPENDIYNKEALITSYNEYNQSVINYFSKRSDDLIIINLKESNSYQQLMSFLQIDSPFNSFPWENKTESINR